MLEDGYSDLSFEGYLMIRLNVIVVMLSVGIGPVAMEANAQSPNPALLAPGQSGSLGVVITYRIHVFMATKRS